MQEQKGVMLRRFSAEHLARTAGHFSECHVFEDSMLVENVILSCTTERSEEAQRRTCSFLRLSS
jgi:hypothetical protein